MIETVAVSLNLGLVSVTGSWKPSDSERRAAWEMYVELITRVPVSELRVNEGLLREALTSLYSLFSTTRDILRRYGPDVAIPTVGSELSFGYIAAKVLNDALRPVLAPWHPRLYDFEASRPERISRSAHEQSWEQCSELRAALNDLRLQLRAYAHMLEDVIGLPNSLIEDRL